MKVSGQPLYIVNSDTLWLWKVRLWYSLYLYKRRLPGSGHSKADNTGWSVSHGSIQYFRGAGSTHDYGASLCHHVSCVSNWPCGVSAPPTIYNRPCGAALPRHLRNCKIIHIRYIPPSPYTRTGTHRELNLESLQLGLSRVSSNFHNHLPSTLATIEVVNGIIHSLQASEWGIGHTLS